MCAGAAKVAAEFQPVKARHGGLIAQIDKRITHVRRVIEHSFAQARVLGRTQRLAYAPRLRRAALVEKKAAFCETKPSVS